MGIFILKRINTILRDIYEVDLEGFEDTFKAVVHKSPFLKVNLGSKKDKNSQKLLEITNFLPCWQFGTRFKEFFEVLLEQRYRKPIKSENYNQKMFKFTKEPPEHSRNRLNYSQKTCVITVIVPWRLLVITEKFTNEN